MSTVYFYRANEAPYGVFCQWYRSPFMDKDGVSFDNTEQYMMYHKALLFDDTASAETILKLSEPRKIKAVGRAVANYDENLWNLHKNRIVYEGNLYKFESKNALKTILLSTKDRELVEASPFDRIWGIGFNEDDADGNKKFWGQNLLGKALMKVRQTLMEKERLKMPKENIKY